VSCPFDPATSGLTTAVNFKGALERIAALLSGRSCYTIEMGAHPTLTLTAAATLVASGVRVMASIESMRREQPSDFWESEASKLAFALDQVTPLPNGTSGAHADDAPDTADALKAILQTLVEIVTSILPTFGASSTETAGGDVDIDSPLMQGGLTSAHVPRLVDEINRTFRTQHSPVLVLEASTLRGTARRLLLREVEDGPRGDVGGGHPWSGSSTPRATPAVAGGGVGRLPGAACAMQLWQVAATGGNAIGEVPALRWGAAASDASGARSGSSGGAGSGGMPPPDPDPDPSP